MTSDIDLGRAHGQVGKLLLAAELYDQAEPHLLNARALERGEPGGRPTSRIPTRLKFQADQAIPPSRRSFGSRGPRARAGLVGNTACRWRTRRSRGAAADESGVAQPNARRRRSSSWGSWRSPEVTRRARRRTWRPRSPRIRSPTVCTTHWQWLIARVATSRRGVTRPSLWDERLYPADPLMEEITDLLKTAVVYEIRGTQAMDDRKWAEAAALFREGLAVAPRDATLHQNRGTALPRRRRSGSGGRVRNGRESSAGVREGALQSRHHHGGGAQGSRHRALLRSVASDPSMVNARASLADACADRASSRPDCRIRLGRQGRSVREPGAVRSRHGAGPASSVWRPARCSRRRRGRMRNSPASRTRSRACCRADDAVRDGPRAVMPSSRRSNARPLQR